MGSSALWPATERSTGACQTPVAAGRTAPWMMRLVPLERSQTATAFPCGSSATWGLDAFWPATERSTGVCQTPLPAGRTVPWMMRLVPLERSQTATAFPCGSSATRELDAFWPATERSSGTSHVGAAPAGAAASDASATQATAERLR